LLEIKRMLQLKLSGLRGFLNNGARRFEIPTI
jgi:hypothetical protein